MITSDEILRNHATKISDETVALIEPDAYKDVLKEELYLKCIMGIRQEEMLQILQKAGLITMEQWTRGPDHEGLSAAWEKAEELNRA
jgi:hypothetical protein